MKREKRERLAGAGWRVGSAEELLGLDAVEAAIVELRLALAGSLRRARLGRRWTQAELARRLGSSQSRVAKMEAADASVSIDLLVRSLLAAGAPPAEIGRAVAGVAKG